MKKLRFGKTKFTDFLSGKGFYAALAVSLVAVGAAAYIAVGRTLNDITKDNTLQAPSTVTSERKSPGNTNDNENVNNPQDNIPVETPQSSIPEPESSTSPAPAAAPKKAGFAMPLTGDVLNPFSKGELVKSKTLGDWRTHDGIDFKAELGTPVKAVSDGTVTEVRDDKKWGICVIIDHGDGYEGHYYNLDNTVNVTKKQKVKLGDVIGKVGNTAQNEIGEEPHLHFGIKKDGKWADFNEILKIR